MGARGQLPRSRSISTPTDAMSSNTSSFSTRTPHDHDAGVLEAGFRQPFRQRLHQPDVAGRHRRPHGARHAFVVHHAVQLVPSPRRERDSPAPPCPAPPCPAAPSATPRSMLTRTRCGARRSWGCTPMDAASTMSRRNTWRCPLLARRGLVDHSSGHSSGLAPMLAEAGPHCRCWPPSSAIIWPVMDRRARMASTARATSSGSVPRCRGVEAHCRANCSADCRALGSAGPRPHRVDPDARRQRQRQRAGQRPQPGLGDGVGHEVRRQRPDALVQQVDHVAIRPVRQGAGEGLGEHERGAQVGLHVPVPARPVGGVPLVPARRCWRC